MIYHPRRRFAFIHIPKTGGKSINRTLMRHMGDQYEFGPTQKMSKNLAAGVMEMVGSPAWEETLSIALVRNPWDRAVSSYFYSRSPDAQQYDRVLAEKMHQITGSVNPSFEHFAAGIHANRGWHRHYHWYPQVNHLYLDGQCLVSRIERFEKMKRAWNSIKYYAGLPERVSLPHLHKSAHTHYADYYTPALRDAIGEVYADDISYFGYSF
jgi:hypothetical protein